jgi:ABC-2 type transport system ATP-binding protein
MLEIKKITKKYNRIPVVKQVSFAVKPGEILGYLGPNGAGKTTTMKILTGILEPTSGDIFFNGKNIYKSKNMLEYKKKMGYIPEENHIYRHLSAFEYLQMVGRLRGFPDKIFKEKIEAMLEQFYLTADMHYPIGSYSKGMKQKVAISAALLHNPDLLLLDEPLAGLDISTTLVFKDLLDTLAKSGKMIIYSSHQLEIIEKISTTVIIINKGNIMAHDPVDALKKLMNLPSLESVFKELVQKQDTGAAARNIHNIMQFG